jgi:Zn finger protein HypA/HybF involved in hydrogenase expression
VCTIRRLRGKSVSGTGKGASIAFALAFTAGILTLASGGGPEDGAGAADPQLGEIQVPAPPFTEGIFPCTGCHDGKSVKLDTARRKLTEMHDDIELKHGPPSRWCLDCHDPQDRDRLRLASGEKVDFSHSYLLCGQCHGDKFRDWKVGVHGKRTGAWNGKKQYLLCVHCHSPHQPRFKSLKPLPPPVPPESLRGGPRPAKGKKEGGP